MNVLEKDLERKIFEVEVEDREDLWHLYNIIDIGDTVCGQTFREVRVSRGDGSEERGGRRKVYLCIEVEDLYFQSFTESLRIRGKVVSGPEDMHIQGQYHTFSLKERDRIKISKKVWLSFHEERLKAAQKKEHPRALVVTIDDQEAEIFLVKEYSMERLFNIQSHVSGKYFEFGGRSAEKSRYLSKVAEELGRLAEKEKAFVIVGGPGFTKSELLSILKEKFKNINAVEENASSIGPSGAREILRRGAIHRILQNSLLIRDSELVEEFLFRLANKPSLVAYGIKEVKEAVERGAVESLLVSGRLMKNVAPEERSMLEEMCKKTEEYGGKVYFIGAEHEKGLQLFNLGGIAALLRFSIS
ncbi:MAG: mRNA surveillance protein pelota [Candidatus Methanomethyliaceae archaeon]|nr:mRNA surveillance protein pelota [Candidatus Methanomethyliaceae archaeon]